MSATAPQNSTMNIPVDHYSIDFDILAELDHGRNMPIILSDRLDTSRNYISNRLRALNRYGMVTEVSEERDVGLYEITELGRVALRNRDLWESDSDAYQEEINAAVE